MQKEKNNTTEATPQEVLDYFTNNQTTDIMSDTKTKPKTIIPLEELEKEGLTTINDETKDNEEIYVDKAFEPPFIQDELFDTSIYLNKQINDTDKLFTDLSTVMVTPQEKESYLRTLLDGNSTFITGISMLNGKVTFSCKSKTMKEQELLKTLLTEYLRELDNKEELKHNTHDAAEYLLKLNLMVTLYNTFQPLVGDEAAIKEAIKNNLEKIDNMSKQYYLMLINVIRIFEQKEVLLGQMMVSGDF